MALILARKIRQYRSIVSILQKTIQEQFPKALPKGNKSSRTMTRNTISNRTGAAGILLVRHHNCRKKRNRPPLLLFVVALFPSLQATSTSLKK
jgi:hypothetical protein